MHDRPRGDALSAEINRHTMQQCSSREVPAACGRWLAQPDAVSLTAALHQTAYVTPAPAEHSMLALVRRALALITHFGGA